MRTIHGTTWSVEDAQAYIKARVKVDANGCWIWQKRALTNGGYGKHKSPNEKLTLRAHRTAYEAFIGPILHGLHVCHRCDVPACCNPAHLWLGTAKDNLTDMKTKGRSNAARGEGSGRARLNDNTVRAIRAEYASGGFSQRALADKYGISAGHVCGILHRKLWAHVSEESTQ